MPSMPVIIPPSGKSGPLTIFIKSSTEASGLSKICKQASNTSVRLCGGILVAIPTAMPEEPFINKLGILVGRTSGMSSVPS